MASEGPDPPATVPLRTAQDRDGLSPHTTKIAAGLTPGRVGPPVSRNRACGAQRFWLKSDGSSRFHVLVTSDAR